MVEQSISLPVILDILGADGQVRPHVYVCPNGVVQEEHRIIFTAPLNDWFDPETGEPSFPRITCGGCNKTLPMFRAIAIEQPTQPGDFILTQTEFCDSCVPRATVRLLFNEVEQRIWFGSLFFDYRERPIAALSTQTGGVVPLDELELAIHHKESLLKGFRFTLGVRVA